MTTEAIVSLPAAVRASSAAPGARLFRAPGRVNLIGEHTDYNDGFVLPMAIDRDVVVAATPRFDNQVTVHSLDLAQSGKFDLDRPDAVRSGRWLNYIEGVARTLQADSVSLRGMDLTIASDVPPGAGLASSAALETAAGLALIALNGTEVDRIALAHVCQKAEHDYIGTQCGIMDQFAVSLAERGSAIVLDCRSLQMEQIPLELSTMAIVICDSRVKHELASSEYNTRRAECAEAIKILRRQRPGIQTLRDVSFADLEAGRDQLSELIMRRCRHVVGENARTIAAGAALRRSDFEELGRLMLQSHASLRDDYNVSCPELDLLVESAESCDGVPGARMTGGGFGGCTVNLVRRDALDSFRETVSAAYQRAFNKSISIYVTEAGAGAEELST